MFIYLNALLISHEFMQKALIIKKKKKKKRMNENVNADMKANPNAYIVLYLFIYLMHTLFKFLKSQIQTH